MTYWTSRNKTGRTPDSKGACCFLLLLLHRPGVFEKCLRPTEPGQKFMMSTSPKNTEVSLSPNKWRNIQAELEKEVEHVLWRCGETRVSSSCSSSRFLLKQLMGVSIFLPQVNFFLLYCFDNQLVGSSRVVEDRLVGNGVYLGKQSVKSTSTWARSQRGRILGNLVGDL